MNCLFDRRAFVLPLPLRVLIGACCLLALVPAVSAQTFDASSLRKPSEINSTWLVHAGDDPAFAAPDFNDSGWLRFDPNKSVKPLFPGKPPEVLWYRVRVKVAPDQKDLALVEHQLASAFEIYINGQKFYTNGSVKPFRAYTYGARILRRVPDSAVASGLLVIALRVHIARIEWEGTGPGYAAENLMIGPEESLREHIWLNNIGSSASGWITQVLGLALGIVALALFTAQPRQKEYLWIFLQFLAIACTIPLSALELTRNVHVYWESIRQFLLIASIFFEVLMFLAFLRLRFGWWARGMTAAAVAGLCISWLGLAQGSISLAGAILGQVPLLSLIAGVLPTMLIGHFRKGNREAGILLIPILLSSLSIYSQLALLGLSAIPSLNALAVRLTLLIFNLQAGPFVFSLNQVGVLLYLLSLAIIMVLRSTRMSRQQAVHEGEMAAAREVQQVILPENFESIPGFAVETIYEPAQQVGGDFFQIIPLAEGGMLLVVGDVAGKGLPAAMLVSMLVGAIRTAAAHTHNPAELLTSLNERLVGRTNGSFSTALVARLALDGQVTIANAGHLSPYLDGREIELRGALPLGIQSGVRYETEEFYCAPGSRLTFYSDGVIEAQNAHGELFGFARGQEISIQPAKEIALAAATFGQNDDITVVAITRQADLANAA